MNLERETEFIYFSVIVLASYNFFLCSFYGGQVRAGALLISACLCFSLFSLYRIMYASIISETFHHRNIPKGYFETLEFDFQESSIL